MRLVHTPRGALLAAGTPGNGSQAQRVQVIRRTAGPVPAVPALVPSAAPGSSQPPVGSVLQALAMRWPIRPPTAGTVPAPSGQLPLAPGGRRPAHPGGLAETASRYWD